MLFCNTCSVTAKSRAALKARSPEAAEKIRISGTWDFKWSPGTTIRVAIQRLPANETKVDLEKASGLLREALDAWLPAGATSANLSYELVGYMPAPDQASSARSDVGALAAEPYLEHDVLVSFALLPTVIPATSELPAQDVNFPRSELGTYATRKEYGVPTIFLGAHGGFSGEPETWFDSAEGKFTVIHEVGHVLGLAHEQQNPRLSTKLAFREKAEMRRIAKLRNARTPPDDELDEFIAGEITEPWPSGKKFSDWRAPPAEGSVDFDSVMAKPVYRCFLAGNHGGKVNCVELAVCPEEQKEFARLTKPTASDLAQLVAMYGTRG